MNTRREERKRAPDLAATLVRGDAYYLALLDEADAYVARNGLDLPEESEARLMPPDPACVTDPILSLDIRAAGITSIVWATGYTQDFGWLGVDAFDDTGRSLAAGARVGHTQGTPSICDALMAPMPGELTFPINRRCAGALTVSDAEVADIGIAHGWCGVLAVPRDWEATVDFDQTTGLGWAGGYVGHGVTATNLAGRTLADLVLGHKTPLTELPWVGHRSAQWEPEPLRWLGVRGMYLAYKAADWHEARGRSGTSPIAVIADKIAGRPH